MNTPVGWLSLADSHNRGNQLIEYATANILGERGPLIAVSSFTLPSEADMLDLHRCSCVILPGATQLDVAEHPIAPVIRQLRLPVIAPGVALCRKEGTPDLAIARAIKNEIGARDPYTYRTLVNAGIPARLVGCSTLFLGRSAHWQQREGPIVISLGRGPQKLLQECIRSCAGLAPVILLEHVPDLQPVFPLPDNVTRILWQDPLQAMALYSSASVVLTGRIHGCLPCIALGTPVLFFGEWYDSRYSLLEYLGIDVLFPDPVKISAAVKKILEGHMPPADCFSRAEELRSSMTAFINAAVWK